MLPTKHTKAAAAVAEVRGHLELVVELDNVARLHGGAGFSGTQNSRVRGPWRCALKAPDGH